MDPDYVASRIISGPREYKRILVKAPTFKEKAEMLAARAKLSQGGISKKERKECHDKIFDYNSRAISCDCDAGGKYKDRYITVGPVYSKSNGDKLAIGGIRLPPVPADEPVDGLRVEPHDETIKPARAPPDWNAAGRGASSGRDDKEWSFPV